MSGARPAASRAGRKVSAVFWQAVCGIAAAAATVSFVLHIDGLFIAAGVMAAGAAVAALREAQLARSGRPSETSGIIVQMLVGAFALSCLLGIAARGPAITHGQTPGVQRPPQHSSSQAFRRHSTAYSMWFIASEMM